MLNELKNKLIEEGISDVGFSNINEYLPQNLKNFNTAITLIVKLADGIVDEITHAPTYSYYSHYRSVNNFIDLMSLKAVLFIESKGYKALSIAASQSIHGFDNGFSGVLSHKIGAVLSGLGFIGKNNLFIHHKFGARVRIGTILTNYYSSDIMNKIAKPQCGDCKICIISCPAQALYGKLWDLDVKRDEMIDPHACSRYMKEKFKFIGRGQVCGICMRVCPWNEKKEV